MDKKHFPATQNTKCGYPDKIRNCGWVRKCIRIQLSFPYTRTLTIENSKRGRYLVVNISHDRGDFRMI